MALTETKLRLSWIVLSAVFISLSVSAVTEEQGEGHRCYWCGPLAEQVHRSQRASKCNGDRSKVTVCDADLPYCAIVASSPPYVESRFCVKFYQDECYSLYCNSTKTWKITCPCRGDLCNGLKTKRENEAFGALLKHNVAKLYSRVKRALISSSGFIGMTMRKKVDNATVEENKDNLNETSANIVTDDDVKDNNSEVDNNLLADADTKTDNTEVNNAQTVAEPEVTSNDGTETTKAEVSSNESPATVPTEAPSIDKNEAKDAEIGAEVIKEISTTKNNIEEVTLENSDNHVSEPGNIQIDIPSGSIDSGDLKTDIILMSSEIPKLANDTKPGDIVTKAIGNVPSVPTTVTEPKPTTVELKATPETTTEVVKTTQSEAKLDKTKSKSSEKLPAAEALQHNETPTTKVTEPMSTSTTTMTTKAHIDVTTHAPAPRNNTAVRINAHILAVVVGIMLHY